MAHFSRTASGSIYPSRFTKLDTSNSGCVIQATAGSGNAGDKTWGISQKSTHLPPIADQYMTIDDGLAAKSGESIGIYGPGDDEGTEVLLCLGGSVSVDDYLKSDANGKGITANTSGDWIGARALQAGVLNDLIRVQVLFPTQMH